MINYISMPRRLLPLRGGVAFSIIRSIVLSG